MAQAARRQLLDFPNEVLCNFFCHLTTPSFLHTISTCHALFDLAAQSREVILHHLRQVPGIKLGLDDHTVSTSELFLLLRQRASAHLFGANFRADCKDHRFANSVLDAHASCLAPATDYFSISLVSKDSLSIRHYGYHCSIKEHTPSPYADGQGKVVQVVHRKHTISVLYAWQPEENHGPIECEDRPSISTKPKLTVLGEDFAAAVSQKAPSKEDKRNSRPTWPTKYHLIHYNAYNSDRPDFFHVPPPPPVTDGPTSISGGPRVPVHLSVHSRLKCAIVWDVSRSSSIATGGGDTSTVIMYAADRVPSLGETGTYTALTLYPLKPPAKPRRDHPSHTNAMDNWQKNIEFYKQFRPRATAFCQDGFRLRLYAPGGIVPYAVLFSHFMSPSQVTANRLPLAPRTLNTIFIAGNNVIADTPFFGHHTFGNDDDDTDCVMTYLHLGATAPIATVGRSPYRKEVLCIVQNRVEIPARTCSHYPLLDDMHLSFVQRTKIVARLWGFGHDRYPTTMTGLDTVATSQNGSRIAIACWDRILVYALQPEIFCEQWEGLEIRPAPGADAAIVNNSNDNNSDSASSSGSDLSFSTIGSDTSSVGRNRTVPMVQATRFYEITKGPLGKIVELKPVVIKLPGGAIARKMMWGSSSNVSVSRDREADPVFSEAESSNDGSDAGSGDEASDNHSVRRHSVHSLDSTLGNLNDILGPDTGDGCSAGEAAATGDIPQLNEDDHVEGVYGVLDPENPIESLAHNGHSPTIDGVPMVSGALDQELDAGTPSNALDVHTPEALGPRVSSTNDMSQPPGAADSDSDSDVPDELAMDMDAYLEEARVAEETRPAMESESEAASDAEGRLQVGKEDQTADDMPTDVLDNAAETELPRPLPLLRGEQITFRGVADPAELPERVPSPPTPPTPPTEAGPSKTTATINRAEQRKDPDSSRPKATEKDKPRKKRKTEDELIVLTDRGVQVWDFGVWARGRREKACLDESLI